MKVLMLHNRYQLPGGEDVVFAAESALLEANGHEVIRYARDNRDIDDTGRLGRLRVAAGTFWSRRTKRELLALLVAERPDVVHFHNTFPLISPSAYSACRQADVPVIQTLHNYRLLCPRADLSRNGRACDECLGRSFAWPGIRHRCYRGSALQTAVVAGMTTAHRLRRTWTDEVDLFITPSAYTRSRFIEGGFPAERLVVKPHSLEIPPRPRQGPGDYALYVGRLTEDKGLETIVQAWERLTDVPLKIVGAGPLGGRLQKWAKDLSSADIRVEGTLPREVVHERLRSARLLLAPSLLFETFGLVVLEAWGCGVPVAASRIGALAELIDEGRTGLLFEPGNPGALAERIRTLWDAPDEALAMGARGRIEFERAYTPEKNAAALLDIYRRVIKS